MLPGLNIKFTNGNIPAVANDTSRVVALVASGVAVASTFALDTPYLVKSLSDVAELGILPDINNNKLHKALKEFYEEAGDGTPLWLIAFAKNTKVSDWFTPAVGTGKAPVEKLLEKAGGSITSLFTCFSPDNSYTLNIENAMDEDVALAKQKAQVLSQMYASKHYAPFYTILEGYGFDGNATNLPDLKTESNNRVGILLGDTKKRTDTPATMGSATQLVAARLANTSVQENIGKVSNGALKTLTAYILDTPIEHYDVESLHDKGFISFRTHVRKAGYYFTDDPLATGSNDDYRSIALRAVIDKAFRLAHGIASKEVLQDFDVNNDGTVSSIYAKGVEGKIEREIFDNMTVRGELSRDISNKDDLGVVAKVDTSNNVVATSRIDLTISVRPKGYARWFNINLGYSQLNS